ncbi:mediator complex subunit MED14-domain-containing protein [Coniella lustricola]|uniref:Mediator of RNA polymerase II transcription subunit 14 n=1 Tax=Coniella lustricola TaxID=2025994 RepID=A0A2T3AIS1_9PEZI|nr:mediator complex subunit MED14-domain-containing protein [Coniella lustricola]
MEIGTTQNGTVVRNNHDRNLKIANGANGAVMKRDPSPNKAKQAAISSTPITNGSLNAQQQLQAGSNATDTTMTSSNPPEIAHITANFIPLPFILQRLAQKSHNDLQTKIEELARMPPLQTSINGNTANVQEDSSEENQNKKANLLGFLNELHTKWTKTLVMSEWSRKSGQVSKLIDLHSHILEQLRKYDMILDRIGHIKRNLYGARLPDPDIKTALQVLSTGRADWMPDFTFIPPPALKADEIQNWVAELNTLLAFRLNLHDYNKRPYAFRNFSIADGRATFKVDGEFEVDLTIADDDPESQWWFINFRFNFSPTPPELNDKVWHFVESSVNDALARDGLKGCYDFLHGYVLTYKIRELQRQAVLLSKQHWIDNLKVEPLNRALCIQYWAQRYPGTGPNPDTNAGPKSWIIVGVNSGKTPQAGAIPTLHPTSYINIRWFRDGKEVTDDDVLFDTDSISAESLLKQIICKHIKHILTSLCNKLMSKPRYSSRQANISMKLHKTEPSQSYLKVQLTHSETLAIQLNTVTGNFYFEPAKAVTSKREAQLNARARDAVEDGFNQIESIRWQCLMWELARLGRPMGWTMCKRPVQPDEAKKLHSSREPYQSLWLKRENWGPAWYIVVCLSLAGDAWWLVELTEDSPQQAKAGSASVVNRPPNQLANVRAGNVPQQPTARIKSQHGLPIKSLNPELSTEFFSLLNNNANLTICAIRDWIQKPGSSSKPACGFIQAGNSSSLQNKLLPQMFFKASAVMQSLSSTGHNQIASKSNLSWAGEHFALKYRDEISGPNGQIQILHEVTVAVKDKSMFSLIKQEHVDRDVRYDAKAGHFIMQIRRTLRESCLPLIATRIKAINRLVEFVTAISGCAGGVESESVTLCQFVFTYGDNHERPEASGKRWKVTLDLADQQQLKISLEPDNPHIRVIEMLNKVVNSARGMKELPRVLQLTLPLHRALDATVAAWHTVFLNNQGTLRMVLHRIDWLVLQFDLPPPANTKTTTANSKSAERSLRLSINTKVRCEEQWWEVQRVSNPGAALDEFDHALRPIFTSRMAPGGWHGLETSAIVKIDGVGIEALLRAISLAIVSLAMGTSGPALQGGAAGGGAGGGMSRGAAIVLD